MPLYLPGNRAVQEPGSGWNVGRLGPEKTGPGPMDDPLKLRELAAWYREFAEKTANPSIWEARLRMAEDLEREADRLERRQAVMLEVT